MSISKLNNAPGKSLRNLAMVAALLVAAPVDAKREPISEPQQILQEVEMRELTRDFNNLADADDKLRFVNTLNPYEREQFIDQLSLNGRLELLQAEYDAERKPQMSDLMAKVYLVANFANTEEYAEGIFSQHEEFPHVAVAELIGGEAVTIVDSGKEAAFGKRFQMTISDDKADTRDTVIEGDAERLRDMSQAIDSAIRAALLTKKYRPQTLEETQELYSQYPEDFDISSYLASIWACATNDLDFNIYGETMFKHGTNRMNMPGGLHAVIDVVSISEKASKTRYFVSVFTTSGTPVGVTLHMDINELADWMNEIDNTWDQLRDADAFFDAFNRTVEEHIRIDRPETADEAADNLRRVMRQCYGDVLEISREGNAILMHTKTERPYSIWVHADVTNVLDPETDEILEQIPVYMVQYDPFGDIDKYNWVKQEGVFHSPNDVAYWLFTHLPELIPAID